MNNLLNYFSEVELKIITQMKDLHLKCTVIVTELFKEKKDKAGYPYLGHLFRVSDRLELEIEKIAALLHDVLEDTEVVEKDLLEVGIPKEIIDIVKIVTPENIDKSNFTKEEKLKLYDKEIDKVINSGNIYAIRLKEADMLDNYDLERIKLLPEDQQEWFDEKYGKQLIKLRKVKGEENDRYKINKRK